MMMKTLLAACIALLAAAPAAGFAAGKAPLLVRSALTRTARVHAAAEDGSSNAEPAKAPDVLPPPPTGVQPSLPAPADGPALDIRLLPYVLVPLLVLASQLFLTFSRDALPTDMLGAADMTK